MRVAALKAMPSSEPDSSSVSPPEGWFPSTSWAVVLAAADPSAPNAAQALERLCRTYWSPLHGYVRRQGYGTADAEDLTQEFFARLLQGNYLATVSQAKGKFRSFLLAALNHFLINEWHRAHADKRGGGQPLVPLQDDTEDGPGLPASPSGLGPERSFERDWALAVLDQALSRLEAQYAAAGKATQFGLLERFLGSAVSDGEYPAVAAQLGMTRGAVSVAVHRLRQRFRDLVREEVAHTVRGPAELEEEMRCLLAALS